MPSFRSPAARARVQLRDITDADVATLYEHQRDPEANAMAAFSPRDRAAFDAHWTKILRDDSLIKKAVLFDGELVGNVSSWAAEGERLVGYWTARSHWGKGIASEALACLLEQIEERPLHAHVAKHNLGSIRVLEKCGFVAVREQEVADEHGRCVEMVYELPAGASRPRRL